MKLYTIGFAQKSARQFFSLLHENGVQKLIDIRINPRGQLSGFARQEDLPYFLDRLTGGCQYLHLPVLAPSREIMEDYRTDHDWERYFSRFEALMDSRDIPGSLDRNAFEKAVTCLLCSEATPEHCHRRLVSERLARVWGNMEIFNL
jgi:uncharacterized protein (DUF488 family)